MNKITKLTWSTEYPHELIGIENDVFIIGTDRNLTKRFIRAFYTDYFRRQLNMHIQ